MYVCYVHVAHFAAHPACARSCGPDHRKVVQKCFFLRKFLKTENNSDFYCTQGIKSKKDVQIYSNLDARLYRTVSCLHFGVSLMFKLVLEQTFQPLQQMSGI